MKKAFVTLVTNDNYIIGPALLKYSLEQVASQFPLYSMVTADVSRKAKDFLTSKGIKLIEVDNIPLPQKIIDFNSQFDWSWEVWLTVLAKFNLFKLTQFDKVIFLDADLYFMENVDEVFDYPDMTAAEDGECFNLWGDNVHFNSGFFVCEPNIDKYNKIMNFVENLDTVKFNQVIADQEILNAYYNEWPQQKNLHLNKYYNVFPCYLNPKYRTIDDNTTADIVKNVKFYHFVGTKPWSKDFELDGYTDFIRDKAFELYKEYNKVVVYSICKNEELLINTWLDNAEEADCICVLDTGSTDNTWKILQERAARNPKIIIKQKVIDPWRFDTARNENLKMIPDDINICCQIDIDETFSKGYIQELKEKWTTFTERADYNYHWAEGYCWNLNKIHSRKWQWQGIVHEFLVRNDNADYFDYETIRLNSVLTHNRQDKARDYLSLMEQRMAETKNPTAFDYLQIANEYAGWNQIDKAKECWDFIINNYTKEEYEIGIAYYKKASFETNIKKRIGWYATSAAYGVNRANIELGIQYYQENNWKAAELFFEEYFSKPDDNYWLLGNVLDLDLIYDLLSISSYQNGNYYKSYFYANKIKKRDTRITENILLIESKIKEENNGRN